MRIKKYIADSMPEVLKLVKDDLGPTAVVLNTRSVGKPGILGKKGQVEVTAAIDDNPRPAAKAVARPAQKGKKAAPKRSRAAAAAPPGRQAPTPAPRIAMPGPDVLARISAQLNDLQAQLQSPAGQSFSTDILPEALGKLATQMEQDDLDQGLAQRVVRDLLTHSGEEGYEANALTDRAVRVLSEGMAPPKATNVSGKIRTVIALVGTSGGGKTTATAKLAAHFSGQGKRVALVSTDTDRVGGLEQIRAYGGILNLPVDLAYTPDEMRETMQKRRETDLIIVDTAGISPIDRDQKEALKDVLREAAPNEIHLVMSAPTGLRQMRDTIAGFKEVGVDRLLFTRLDETSRYGAACSVAIESDIPVSYVTNSRIVPGDLWEADVTTLTRALFVRSLNGTAGN